jgi:hypothetical protein
MSCRRRVLSVSLAIVAFTLPVVSAVAAEPKAEILSVEKIWDAGHHNAFTDLIRWHDKFWCTFREADAHVGGDGVVRVLVSDDGTKWESAAGLTEKGIDLRDPKFAVTPDDRLMLVMGGSHYEGKTLLGRWPRVAFSKDGKDWTAPQKITATDGVGEGDWLWRVTWHEGTCYGVCYDASQRATQAAKDATKLSGPAESGKADWKLKFVKSADGIKYEVVKYLDVPGFANETTTRFLVDGSVMLMVRREAGTKLGWIGTSKAPFQDWSWNETSMRFGGPNFIQLPNGQIWGVTRKYAGESSTGKGSKTELVKIDADEKSVTQRGEFPSGGDTSYAGLVWYQDLLWVSYYSSHEGKTSIYLAKVRLP